MGIILAFLFVLQIISFMIIALLFMKVSKFNNLEKKQQQLMWEMDQSVLAYLTEVKEENDRLIKRLNNSTAPKEAAEPAVEKKEKPPETEKFQQKAQPVPMHFALRSYQKTAVPKQEVEPLNDRQLVKQLHEEGENVQEIAKKLGKGQTEVELILKFD
ncbi:helix-turn-helix domain-containing protein [Sporosarcina sp. GW1-11]|uniref:helix-turn-helix domain-containing protein n=1 Tax=Sporosarcina sp. GW1-11 TaxID=2899126 RepID=UPI00294BD03D|nr:helix-turn-helix domain-containing protein [Sporosarcina sp. GW1-11]MDV6376689.1 helix-turn-helix domain-containing protein [Sporosarcina sp. GW1-11]